MVKEYDGIVALDIPIHISNDEGEQFKIYGLLYKKEEAHAEDLWIWNLNRYLCYLMGCEANQEKNGRVEKELLITYEGEMMPLTSSTKNQLYRLNRDEIIGYRLVEFDTPFTILEDEKDGCFIISAELLSRNGINTNIIKTEIFVYEEIEDLE